VFSDKIIFKHCHGHVNGDSEAGGFWCFIRINYFTCNTI